jgi:hypothetical protein
MWLHFFIKGSKLTHAPFLHIQNEHSFDLHMDSVSMSVPDVSALMFVLFVLRACFEQAYLQVRQPRNTGESRAFLACICVRHSLHDAPRVPIAVLGNGIEW